MGVAAGRVIRANKGRLAPQLLEQAIENGVKRKNEYCEQRVEAGAHRAWIYKKIALSANAKDDQYTDVLSYDEIELLTEPARKKQNETIEDFITDALHAGLLAPVKGMLDYYKIPIPSLGDYLRSAKVEPIVPD